LEAIGLLIQMLCVLSMFRNIVSPEVPPEELQVANFWKAPIQKEVDNSYHMVRFNGSFLKENTFRQPAGPEVDAAWESLGINCKFSIFEILV
jgi:hypothetical protein